MASKIIKAGRAFGLGEQIKSDGSALQAGPEQQVFRVGS